MSNFKIPPEPIIIQTPQENIIAKVTFHSGNQDEKNTATTLLLTMLDFNEEGNLKRKDISYTEMQLKSTEVPEELRKLLKEDFASYNITDDSYIIMRLFRDLGNGEWEPVFYHDEKELKNENS